MSSLNLKESPADVIILGAGLAGSECAWQLAQRGHRVALIEQRPERGTEAHIGPFFAELVCSNSLKSNDPESAPGLLKAELRELNSLILEAAYECQIPAGQALGVDRDRFCQYITKKIEEDPLIEIHRVAVDHFEELLVNGPKGVKPVVIATGPLTGHKFAESLQQLVGDRLYFYDAIAPIVAGESIDKSIAFLQNRHDKGNEASLEEGDYLNCPFSEEEYNTFITALKGAEKVQTQDFEKALYFQGCQPIEALLERGDRTLAFGPMKPVGLTDPRTGKQPYAVLQLRREDLEGRSWNLVGFQTKLKYPEQKRVFSLIPGLANAEFYRFGSLHRNTYVHSPTLLDTNFRLKKHPTFHFAGQITGVEGYLESCAIGALVGRLLSLRLKGMEAPLPPPPTTALGALAAALFDGRVKNFQPMNINWGLIPLNEINERDKEKRQKLHQRARRNFKHWHSLFGI